MTEKLSETDINRLRGVVGLGTSKSEVRIPEPRQEPVKEEAQDDEIIPKPKGAPRYEPKNIDNYIKPEKSDKKIEPAKVSVSPDHNVETDLFVKIDEHAEIAKKLIDSKTDIKSIADTISLLTKAENLKAEAIERLEAHLNELDAKLDTVEEKLSMPEGFDYPMDAGIELGPSSDVSNLHRTLENLKDQLNKLE